MRYDVEIILLLALGMAAWIGWQIRKREKVATAPAPAPGGPPGSGIIPLGQFAVAPDRRWLLTTPGG